MQRWRFIHFIFAVCTLAVIMGLPSFAQQAIPRDYQEVLRILNRQGTFSDRVLVVPIIRSDIRFSIENTPVPAEFGFTGEIAMTRGNRNQDVLLGELVLRQHEVNPIITTLLNQNFDVTGVSNHFLWDRPRVIFVHFTGIDQPADLARRLRPALDQIGRVSRPARAVDDEDTATGTPLAAQGQLTISTLNRILGYRGIVRQGGVVRYMIDRDDINLVINGARITERMGLDHEVWFYGTDQRAAVAGEMALLPREVAGVVRALRRYGLAISAMHHHWIGANPDIIFLHFQGFGTANQLANGVRAALSQTGNR